MVPKITTAIMLIVACFVPKTWASDIGQLQFGTMYAQHIEGVGLYAGIEMADVLPYSSAYFDATLLISSAYDAQEPVFGGVSMGLRSAFDVPLSPYVGAGIYLGQNEKEVRADNDNIDNNGNGFKDEVGEMKTDNTAMVAIYPEVGVRLDIAQHVTVRVMGRYMVSSFGRPHDDWFYGLSFAFN
jgi:opacity protein-like surface antigen